MNSQNTKNTSPVNDAELLKTTISLLKRTMAFENYLHTFSNQTRYSHFFARDPEEETIKDMFNLGAFRLMTIFNFCDTFGIDPFQIPDQPIVLPGNHTPGHYLAPFLDKLGDHAVIVRSRAHYIIGYDAHEAGYADECDCNEFDCDECNFVRISDDDRAEMNDALTKMNLLIKDIVAHETLCQTSPRTPTTTSCGNTNTARLISRTHRASESARNP